MRPDPTRCLLLIDDEPAQRRLVTAIGARAGWWVRGAPDVEAAAAWEGGSWRIGDCLLHGRQTS